MTRFLLVLAFASFGCALSQAADTPASVAVTTNTPVRRQGTPAVRSPEVLADGQVVFRVRAPKAAEVQVGGQWAKERQPMTRGEDGLWTATVGPVKPGVYEYSFQMDGVSMIDPGNPWIKPMREPRTSILHIPGDPPLPHDFQPVPHGTVHQHAYASRALNRTREVWVYTPPGYEKSKGRRYPVLYLQHGSGDNQATWVVHGKAHWILDNLLAQKRIRPMVMVMMDGHALIGSGGGSGYTNNTVAFEKDLLGDVMPLVETNYRVETKPAGRALAGLSMGGGQALTIGLNHPERFGWVGGFSSSVPSAEAIAGFLKQPDSANSRLRLLWIACGKDDFLLQRNKDFVALLSGKGIRHEWLLTEGDHSWPIWRLYLADFAPKLFQ